MGMKAAPIAAAKVNWRIHPAVLISAVLQRRPRTAGFVESNRQGRNLNLHRPRDARNFKAR
jgi:hypothetical protein